MEMKRCLGASILLVLSLEAAALLVAGHPFVDGVATIRLPSSDNEVTKPARPWKCCDNAAPCTRSMPPTCQCADEVEECAPTCKDCVESTLHPSLFVCKDRYFGDPGPICKPWECCDAALCTKSIPPICSCVDEVDQCAATCKSCVASTSDPYRYVCEDTYRGFPGRMCNPDNKYSRPHGSALIT